MVIFTFIFPPGKYFAAFFSLTLGLGAILIILFWTKGEPPRRNLENDPGRDIAKAYLLLRDKNDELQ